MSAKPTTLSSTRLGSTAARVAVVAGVAGAAALAVVLSRCAWRKCSARAAAKAATSAVAPQQLPLVDAAPHSRPYALLLFDVEGTTTPISFVKEVLFPYVRSNVRDYLRRTYADSQQTRADVDALRQLAEEDLRNGVAIAPQIPAAPAADADAATAEKQLSLVFEAAEANVLWQMSSDRKSTALKALQGHMWAEGYASGELKGQLFGGADGDVAGQLRAWHAEGYALGVYSSGSVGAQQLLFSHSDAGNLQPLFCCNFDTVVGMKQQAGSYAAIAARAGLTAHPERILFFTDVWGEAHAAMQAGVAAVLLDRPGNAPLPAEQQGTFTFPVAHSFQQVQEWMQLKAQGKGPLHQLEQQMQERAKQNEGAAAAVPAVDTSKGAFNTF